MNESQAFRVWSTSEVIIIPTCYDPKSGQHAIRWSDVHQYLENAGILNGKSAVLFLTNSDLEEWVYSRTMRTEFQVQQFDNALQKIQSLERQAQHNIQNSEMMRQQTSEILQKRRFPCHEQG
ncbi:hypothetical protein BGX34_009558 [Mortierella sp. NVP85]|nr:hypothetical protein BGX34_009558 [Mortierella sp. NVP85]